MSAATDIDLSRAPGPVLTEEPDRPRPLDRPRLIERRTRDDALSLAGSAAGSLAFTWLTFTKILGWSGPLGFVVVWFVLFLVLYTAVSAWNHPRTEVIDRLAAAVVTAGAVVVGFALATTVVYTVVKGIDALVHLNFYTDDMAGVRPTDELGEGGILHAMIGSFVMVGIATLVALPLGIGTALYITEVGSRGGRWVRAVVEAMIGLPDVLAGLFVYVILIINLGAERSGFAAAMALAIMMTPIIARSSEVQLRVVPGGLREAGLALGATRWRTVKGIVVPTAKAGLATALILGLARAVGETAPVLITSGATTFTNVNPMSEPMNSLPLFILFAVRSPEPLFQIRGFGAAVVLLGIVLALFVFTRLLTKDRMAR
jgi:phosphate transport system permease protein